MTKSEFLDALRRALNGNMAAASVDDNISFMTAIFIQKKQKEEVRRKSFPSWEIPGFLPEP